MKFILLTLVLALPIAYLFGEEEYKTFATMRQIEESPAVAPAVVDKVMKSGRKRFASYRVHFSFEVNGRRYHSVTTPTDEQGATRYISEQDTKVMYSTRDPSVNTLKRYYDLRHTHGTLPQSLIVSTCAGLLLAVPPALVVGWLLKWFRRKSSHMPSRRATV
jgi:hypothetical protein